MTRLLRLLLVEDSDDDAELLLAELQRGGMVVEHLRVQTATAMRAALAGRPWDIIVSDYAMPAFSGLGALLVLQESGLDIPLIIASGTIGEETAVAALKAGAADFLVKDRLARLVPAIERETREAEGRRALRATEAELLRTRERMQFALEAAGVGVWEAELATGRHSWSDVLERLHGLTAGEFGGTLDAFIDCVHPEDRQAVRDKIAESVRKRLDARLAYRTIWPDGSIHWIAGIGRTIYSDHGQPIRSAGIGFDVTANKELEEQFRQAQKLEAIGGLAAGVAHDFNNLLTVVTGYCGLLAERFADDPVALKDLDQIRQAGTSATALTGQLLAFSRKQIVAPRNVDLNASVTDSLKMVRRLVEESVRLDVRLVDSPMPVYIDPGQVEQVILNLVINARDAMPNGGVVTIETAEVTVDEPYVRTHLEAVPGDYILLSISDTGSGMSADTKLRLFEPFFTTKERGRGTGLGLATVYGIVKQSGGHIWVYSELGIGTTFKIYWPVSATEVEEVKPHPPAPLALDGRETILVVEDEEPLRLLTMLILSRHGYTVLLAANGDEAQRICTEHQGPIHAALLDVVMPGLSGRMVADWMAERLPETKVIYCSGYTDNAIAHHGVLDTGTMLLQKPFTPNQLLEAVRRVLA